MEIDISGLSQAIAHAAGICSYTGSCVDCGVGCRVFKVVQFYAKVQKYIAKGGTEPYTIQCLFCEHLTTDAAYLPNPERGIGCNIAARAKVIDGRCSEFKLYQPVSYFYKVLRSYILPGTPVAAQTL